jgi:hypothetical protein
MASARESSAADVYLSVSISRRHWWALARALMRLLLERLARGCQSAAPGGTANRLPASALQEGDRDGDDQHGILDLIAGSGAPAHAAFPISAARPFISVTNEVEPAIKRCTSTLVGKIASWQSVVSELMRSMGCYASTATSLKG